MRSISYILGGKPSNLADCLDYAQKHKAQRVILNLHSQEDVGEQVVVRWLAATYIWVFDDTATTYDLKYGGCFAHEPVERQQLSVDNANRRLEADLELITERLGEAILEAASKQYDYSNVYRTK